MCWYDSLILHNHHKLEGVSNNRAAPQGSLPHRWAQYGRSALSGPILITSSARSMIYNEARGRVVPVFPTGQAGQPKFAGIWPGLAGPAYRPYKLLFQLPDSPAYIASANLLIASSHPASLAKIHGKCPPITYPIRFKQKQQFRFNSKKIVKDARDTRVGN